MCEENSAINLMAPLKQGTPPHVWGIYLTGDDAGNAYGNTPTCVGNISATEPSPGI